MVGESPSSPQRGRGPGRGGRTENFLEDSETQNAPRVFRERHSGALGTSNDLTESEPDKTGGCQTSEWKQSLFHRYLEQARRLASRRQPDSSSRRAGTRCRM